MDFPSLTAAALALYAIAAARPIPESPPACAKAWTSRSIICRRNAREVNAVIRDAGRIGLGLASDIRDSVRTSWPTLRAVLAAGHRGLQRGAATSPFPDLLNGKAEPQRAPARFKRTDRK